MPIAEQLGKRFAQIWNDAVCRARIVRTPRGVCETFWVTGNQGTVPG